MRLKTVSEAFDDSRFPPGVQVPDVVKLLNYRAERFGIPMCHAAEEVMRGASEWTVGELELMAALVSQLNSCPFCVGVHAALASIALDDETVLVALDDLESAPISPGLKAVCRLIIRLNQAPYGVTPSDIEVVRETGVSNQAIADALHVTALFDIINRCANALDFELADNYVFGANHPLLQTGYLGQIG